jgi:glutaconate CoA-transferase subunit A
MRESIANLVNDGDVVALEGFTHLICFAAGQELIRQKKRNLTLCRLTPDIITDQMIAAGLVSRLIFSWMGNPGVGSLHAIRRAVEQSVPDPIQIEEYSHFGMVGRYIAGGSHLPFFPLRSYTGSDMPRVNPSIAKVKSPFGDEEVYAVPPLNPDVTIIHVQRASARGDCQVWGILGCQKEAAFAATRVIVVCEELVNEAVIRSDPNRTLLPGLIVDAVVVEPKGCHPSGVQGYYDRDNPFYVQWDAISRNPSRLESWLQEWVYGVEDRSQYIEKIGCDQWAALQPRDAWSSGVNYGLYGTRAPQSRGPDQ